MHYEHLIFGNQHIKSNTVWDCHQQLMQPSYFRHRITVDCWSKKRFIYEGNKNENN